MPRKNFNKVPAALLEEAARLEGDVVQVASARRIPIGAIQNGDFSHVGLTYTGDAPLSAGPLLPPKSVGKYSARNQEGRELIREDLPKVWKNIYMGDRPVYGDWSKGSFPLYADREVFQREQEEPKGYRLESEVLAATDGSGNAVIKFSINPPLDKNSESFESDLLYQINILQENVGSVGIERTDVDPADLIRRLVVEWEILPPGEGDAVVRQVVGSLRNPSQEDRARIIDRKEFLESLGPRNYVLGLSGDLRYFGAQFQDDLVVFENIEYGNALYIMYENWQELSRLSRRELMLTHTQMVDRVVHSEGWKKTVRALVDYKMGRVRGVRRRRRRP